MSPRSSIEGSQAGRDVVAGGTITINNTTHNEPSAVRVGSDDRVVFGLVAPPDRLVGREDLIAELRQRLHRGDTEGTTLTSHAAVHGMGGIGKTALVAEYCLRYRAEYGFIWWVVADGAERLAGEYVRLARWLGFDELDPAAGSGGRPSLRNWGRRPAGSAHG